VSSSQILLTLGFDALDFSPGFIKISVSTTSGANSSAYAIFDNGQNLGRQAGTRFVFLDQEAGMVRVYNVPKASGLFKPTRSCFVGSSLANSIAADNVTGIVVISKSGAIVELRPNTCQIVQVIGLWPNNTSTAAKSMTNNRKPISPPGNLRH
jgi:hypothetical protein